MLPAARPSSIKTALRSGSVGMDEIGAVAPAGGDAIFDLAVILKHFEHPDRADYQRDHEDHCDDIDEVAIVFLRGIRRLRRLTALVGRLPIRIRHDQPCGGRERACARRDRSVIAEPRSAAIPDAFISP